MSKPGKLFLCATPIGNLEDITLRVLKVLKEVDLVAAEDTRRTRKLLTHYKIHQRLTSFNQVNEKEKAPKLIDRLRQGEKVALVSDAGSPGIADPGHYLLKLCLDAGIEYEYLPGPSALIAAAISSGLPTDDIRFVGFPPRREGARRRRLRELLAGPSTLVLYESPHRLRGTLADLAEICPDRRVVLLKEMTKKFAARLSGRPAEVAAELSDDQLKGEFVLVIEGGAAPVSSPAEIKAAISNWLSAGCSASEAARLAAAVYDITRKEAYDLSLKLKHSR